MEIFIEIYNIIFLLCRCTKQRVTPQKKFQNLLFYL